VLTSAQSAFLELLVSRQALKFGDFTLKSGRKSPYFINTGCFHMGGDLAALGAAAAYERLVGRPVGWAYDRKEAKDHGDGGLFVGHPLTPGTTVAIVDDVLTAGTALRETLTKLKPTGVTIAGAVVAVDRQEKGQGSRTAIQEIEAECGIRVAPIITITAAAEHLGAHDVGGRRYLGADDLARIRRHLAGA
jgi:orotate phosphoribosyltransferase